MDERFESFVNEIKEKVEEKIGCDYEVRIEMALKNNSQVIHNIVIRNTGGEYNANLAPAINLKSCYSQYILGKTTDELAQEIIRIYHEGVRNMDDIDPDTFNSDNAGELLFYRIVNRERNRELLLKVPYVPYLDLAVTFHYLCNTYDDAIQSFRIDNRIMKDWNLTIPKLYEMAHRNTPVLFPERLIDMEDALQMFDCNECDDIYDIEDDEMYILSNDKGINGATVLLYSKKIGELSELYRRNIYIIPSSIHELMLLPESGRITPQRLRQIINDVNTNCVDMEEQLSDEVYIYDRDSKSIHIC